MDIYELFERSYADQTGESAEWIKGFRMRNGSYALAKISAAFRYFKAGFEANQGEKMQVLGFISKENARNVSDGWSKEIWSDPRHDSDLAVYVKQSDAPNKGVD